MTGVADYITMVGVRIGPASVIAATALLAVSLAAAPLYVSSSATAALHVGLDKTCATDVGLNLTMPAHSDVALDTQLADVTKGLAHVEAPINTTFADGQFTVVGADGVRYRAIVIARDGDDAQLGIDPPLATGQVAVQAYSRKRADLGVGSVVSVATSPGLRTPGAVATPVTLNVTNVVDDIPFSPEQSYWCGARSGLRPNPGGDPPPQWLIMNMNQMVQVARPLRVFRQWELRVEDEGLTRDEAAILVTKFQQIADATKSNISGSFDNERSQGYIFRQSGPQTPQLSKLLRQANTVSDVVAKTVEPIRLSGAAASLLLLVGAGVLVARQRRRDFRLRLIRGESPWTLMASSMRSDALFVAFGGLIGFGLSVLAVKVFGPSSLLESSAVRIAVLFSAASVVVSSSVVGGSCAFATHRSVDPRAQRLRRRYPFEWAAVVLVFVSYRRLDRLGGVQLVGADAKGGDLLAQAFPLILLVVPLVIIARPLMFALRSSRRWGARLLTPVWLGMRRVAGEPGVTAVIVLTTALAFGAFVVSTAMTRSARQLLIDKSQTFVGADVEVNVASAGPVPADLDATLVQRIQARSNETSVDVLGVDVATFADVVHMRADATSSSLANLVRSITSSGDQTSIAAVVVGGTLPTDDLVTLNRQQLPIRQVGHAAFFAGQRNGAVLVVVDAAALTRLGLGVTPQVWVQHPPSDIAARLTTAGFTVLGSPQSADSVLSVVSFLAIQWSYAALRAFGLMIGLVAILVQLVVLDSRRKARRAAVVLTRSMGMRRRDDTIASTTEIVVPVLVGFLLAMALSVAMLQVAVPNLDTLRNLQPPARVVIDLTAIWIAAVVGIVVTVALAVYDTARTGHPIRWNRCAMDRRPVVSIIGVTRRFGQGSRSVLALVDVDADIAGQGLTCIAGPSGSGKSTLVNLIGCLDRPQSGNVVVAGVDVTHLGQRRRRHFRRRMLGLVSSVPTENLISTLDVAANVRFAVGQRRQRPYSPEQVAECIARVGLEGRESQRISELSGGEQLRLGVACALIGSPRLLIADEPTASLDHTTADSIVDLFRTLTVEGVGFVVATHDHHVLDAANSVVHLDHGRRVS